jgi:transcription antitermination factor NusG
MVELDQAQTNNDQVWRNLSMSATLWFALRVRPRHEKSVSASLRSREIEPLLPLYVVRNKWKDRYKEVSLPLFPGYVFSRFEYENRSEIFRTPGVIDIVRFGETLLPVDPAEMESLQRLVDSGLACEPYLAIDVGERVEICDGPFCGQSGLVTEIRSKLRLVLSVSLLQRSVLVEFNREWVRGKDKATFPYRIISDAHELALSKERTPIVSYL